MSDGKAPLPPLKPAAIKRLKQAQRRQRGKGNATMMAQRFAKGLFKS
jgi:hypothetical protein